MKRVYSSILLSILLLGYAFHFFVTPFVLFSKMEFFSILIGIFIISFSIVSTPFEFVEKIGRKFFSDYKFSSAKSLFIGLSQYVTLQLIGWHFITWTCTVSHGILIEKGVVDGSTIVQTAGTIASLIFAAFQTVTASAENQYEVKGRLRFDKNDELYFYLRLTLSAAMGSFIGQMKALPVVNPFAQAQLLLSILFLVPLISILFKSFKPESILNKSNDAVDKSIEKLFLNIKSADFGTRIYFENICNSLTQISIVSSWSFKHKVNIRWELIRKPFTKSFAACFEFLKNLESDEVVSSPVYERIFEDLAAKRRLSIVNLNDDEMQNLDQLPLNFPRKNLDFLDELDLPLKMIESFFLPFKNLIISSLEFNGMNYASLQDLITEFIDNVQKLNNISWRRALYLMILGDFTDGILSLPKDHNASVEITHLWFLLLQAREKLGLANDNLSSEHFNFCKNQFSYILSDTNKN